VGASSSCSAGGRAGLLAAAGGADRHRPCDPWPIKAETGAIEHSTRSVEETDGVDPVTQDIVIKILHDEQGHRRLFEGFLREYELEGR
jgi:hypothetical protein